MKVTIEKTEETTNAIKYPCLMESGSGTIILFSRRCTGTVISSETLCYPIGYQSDEWAMDSFEVLPKGTKIILENE